ncbi:hypothetical protein KOI35_26695 [Actinoplanes bogorensis]|uniref:SWIM-type domain-containing protein n=1 Tax=Paractinoplanes bogorensis TaxID=1610840 RepID=A0ABS5YVK2_9ACTN|nr:hypothetical protein [Actinoplanes bogorensis]MBU2667101.1 hypothetical protein [Actinoplanes bogorensis]
MRADLRALTPETLAELTNRGLVKRAAREIEKAPPSVAESPDGSVEAVFDDGVVTTLAPGGLGDAHCTCGATVTCRHVVGLVLAYQRIAAVPSAEPAPTADPTDAADHADSSGAAAWSPGDFSDDELEGRVGARMMVAARRTERAGYVARVHRSRAGDPVASVELPTATVRFLVPGNLGFARSDAVAGVRDDVIVLAVWAFRAADRVAPEQADVQVQVGGTAVATVSGSGLDAALELTALVLREGAVHVGNGLAADIATVRRSLEAGQLRWPLLAVEDLVAQLEAYRERSARYRPEALADHLAELHARHRAVIGGGASLRSRVLGTDEASETPLRRARLDGLGCRVSAVGAERVVDIYLAHADSASVLVLRRAYETDDPGPVLAGRRVGGVSVSALAAGAVVTESAVRSASRTVRLGARRLSRTEAMHARGSWKDLPGALVATDLAGLAAELDTLAPRPVRARIEAELVRVIPVAEVQTISYAPGDQRLDAVIADAAGNTAVVSAVHAACAPGRLDSMAAALSSSEVRYVAGSVRRGGGGVRIDPIGFAVGDAVVVPDLLPAEHAADPGTTAPADGDPLTAALDESLGLLAEVAHRGLLHVPSTMPGRLREAAGRLTALGLRHGGSALKTFAGRLGPDPGDEAVECWVDAHLRLSLAADMR